MRTEEPLSGMLAFFLEVSRTHGTLFSGFAQHNLRLLPLNGPVVRMNRKWPIFPPIGAIRSVRSIEKRPCSTGGRTAYILRMHVKEAF